jgi:hypothetical protein
MGFQILERDKKSFFTQHQSRLMSSYFEKTVPKIVEIIKVLSYLILNYY